ncbi:MAG: hypothetical protein AAGC46_08910, partial [Solirubrobacteraceae bacterium]|nr:hypothetical protein [Patulibacter sp.]
MSGFDDLRAELRAGVVRQADLTTVRRRRRRWRDPLRLLPVAVVATLSITGAAVGAVTLLRNGDPVPISADHLHLGRAPVHRQVLPLRVADPSGGLPWAVQTFRP